jgi:hypothetical protein
LISAKDSSENISSSKSVEVNITGGLRKSIDDIKIAADRTNTKIILTWKYEGHGADKILIYRAEGNENVTLYKSIRGDASQFADKQVRINASYTYYLKVIFKDGAESGFGKKVEIVF